MNKAFELARKFAASNEMKLVVQDLSKENPFFLGFRKLVKGKVYRSMLILPCEQANFSSANKKLIPIALGCQGVGT